MLKIPILPGGGDVGIEGTKTMRKSKFTFTFHKHFKLDVSIFSWLPH